MPNVTTVAKFSRCPAIQSHVQWNFVAKNGFQFQQESLKMVALSHVLVFVCETQKIQNVICQKNSVLKNVIVKKNQFW